MRSFLWDCSTKVSYKPDAIDDVIHSLVKPRSDIALIHEPMQLTDPDPVNLTKEEIKKAGGNLILDKKIPNNAGYDDLAKISGEISPKSPDLIVAIGGERISEVAYFLSVYMLLDPLFDPLTAMDLEGSERVPVVLVVTRLSPYCCWGGYKQSSEQTVIDPKCLQPMTTEERQKILMELFVILMDSYFFSHTSPLFSNFLINAISGLLGIVQQSVENDEHLVALCCLVASGIFNLGSQHTSILWEFGERLSKAIELPKEKGMALILVPVFEQLVDHFEQKMIQLVEEAWGISEGDLTTKIKCFLNKLCDFTTSLELPNCISGVINLKKRGISVRQTVETVMGDVMFDFDDLIDEELISNVIRTILR